MHTFVIGRHKCMHVCMYAGGLTHTPSLAVLRLTAWCAAYPTGESISRLRQFSPLYVSSYVSGCQDVKTEGCKDVRITHSAQQPLHMMTRLRLHTEVATYATPSTLALLEEQEVSMHCAASRMTQCSMAPSRVQAFRCSAAPERRNSKIALRLSQRRLEELTRPRSRSSCLLESLETKR